jgi:hypothetical protein
MYTAIINTILYGTNSNKNNEREAAEFSLRRPEAAVSIVGKDSTPSSLVEKRLQFRYPFGFKRRLHIQFGISFVLQVILIFYKIYFQAKVLPWYLLNNDLTIFSTYIHTTQAFQIFLRNAHVLPKLLSYDEYCRRDR